MKYFLLLLLFLTGTHLSSQAFYDEEQLQTIEIEFSQSNWDQLLDIAYANDQGYILAESVTINEVKFDSVGVKYKGNSTYNANQVKNPFHIELDTYKEQDYQGFKDIKLSNIAKDPSFLREVLSYLILRKYMVAPRSNYANVTVNGELIGLYSNSESITKTFTNTHLGSKGNTFVKCNPPAGAGPQSNDFPNLVYLGEDSTSYYDAYELKTDNGWNELIDLCDTLSNHIESIEEILDVDRALWMLAYNNVMVNLDSYIGAFTQNYYLYRDDYGRFVPIIWDLNESFGKFSMTGSSNLNNTTSKQQMSHLLHQSDNNFPLIKELLAVPMYKRMYLAHFKTILLENFDSGSYYEDGLTLKNVIDEAVQNDENKLFSYANFQTNLDDDISGGGPGPMGGSTPGIANLMDGRTDYLLGLSDFSQQQPTIHTTELSTTNPVIGESIFLTASVSDGQVAYVGFRNNKYEPFEKVQMMDDGMQGDGAAGDGIFGVEFMIQEGFTQYFIYVENENIGRFSPDRAEHEYHTIVATTVNTALGDLVVNEFMASNDATVADADGEYDDWIELYNNSSDEMNLEGYFLSDDADELTKWEFPENTLIEGNGYLMIWADNDLDQEGLHAAFKLSAASESIFLVDPMGEIVDEVSYIDQQSDISYGRFPNGTGSFITMNPTFGTENLGLSSVSEEVKNELTLYPNPVTDYIIIQSADDEVVSIEILDSTGKMSSTYSFSRQLNVDVSSWNPGLYIVKSSKGVHRFIVN
ncbi:MAG: CotH kinase family protein [Saprospiraceae bacterium]|nr:CotH kinase family protein [Saprospiraceae bacterium]